MTAYDEKHHLRRKNAPFGPLVQHLQSLCLGQLPAFQLSHRVNQSSGPFTTFQKALYKILHEEAKKEQTPHYPFIVQPAQLKTGETGFYSFNKPLPYLTVHRNDGKALSAVDHCVAVMDIVRGHYEGTGPNKDRTAYKKHFKFFCNGADGKPYVDDHPLGNDHYALTLKDFLLKTELESMNGSGAHKVMEDHICLTDDFFTTGVMISP